MATQTKTKAKRAQRASKTPEKADPRAKALSDRKTAQGADLQASVNPSANPHPTNESNQVTPVGWPGKTTEAQAQRTKQLHNLSDAVRDASGAFSHNEIRHAVNREIVAIEAGEPPRKDPVAPGHAILDDDTPAKKP